MEFDKLVDTEGPLLKCIFPGCNVKTNGRWKYGDIWVPACKKQHLSARLLKDMKEEMLRDGMLKNEI